MSDPNDRLERSYRSLAREEPPASLDAEILAAARRAVARPSLARRWGVPVSVAALLVLAIGVTLEMQHEEPGVEVSAPGERAGVAPQGAPAPQAPLQAQPQSQERPQPEAKPQPQGQPQLEAQPQSQAHPQSQAKPLREEIRRKDAPKAAAPAASEAPAAREIARPFAAAPVPMESRGNAAKRADRFQAAPPAGAESPPARSAPTSESQSPRTRAVPEPGSPRTRAAPEPESPSATAAPAPRSEAAANMAKRSAADATADTMAAPGDPHAELERIAKLREAGREAEADRALEEFRKRYPDYRIDDAMWRRVKPR